MNTLLGTTIAAAAIAALATLAPSTAVHAASASNIGSEPAPGTAVGQQRSALPDLRRQPALEEALRAHGYRPTRLSRAEERALANTLIELFPGFDVRRERLNPTQAAALVYMALVYEGRNVGTGWGSQRAACETVSSRLGDAETAFAAPGRGQPRFLASSEQQRLRSVARDLSQHAEDCGERRLSEAADDLVRLTASQRVEREVAARQVARLRSLARLAIASR
jgi:hypothetical protein